MFGYENRRLRREVNRRVDGCISLLSDCPLNQRQELTVNCFAPDQRVPSVDGEETTSVCDPCPDREQVNVLSSLSTSEGCQRRSYVQTSGVNDSVVQGGASDGEDTVSDFRGRLQAWAVESQSSHVAVTSLFGVLRSHGCLASLPLSARALLQTPRKSLSILDLAGGKYHHFGLEIGLRRTLQDCEHMPSELRLTFNIDGLPLTKSSKGQFWTILGRINLLDKPPFVVGCFYCDSKPKDANEFLRRFVNELKLLMTSGIVFGTLEIPVALHALICDAPAKAFALSIAAARNVWFRVNTAKAECASQISLQKGELMLVFVPKCNSGTTHHTTAFWKSCQWT